jgi:hypothetical protein
MGGKKPQKVQKIVIICSYYVYIHAHIARCTELTLSLHNFRSYKNKRNWRVGGAPQRLSSELKGATDKCHTQNLGDYNGGSY